MPSADQLSCIKSALAQVNAAIPIAQKLPAQASDPNDKQQLAQYCILLTDLQTALTEAKIVTDNAIFAARTITLNTLAGNLKAQAASLKTIMNTLDTAGKVAGCVGQALALVAQL